MRVIFNKLFLTLAIIFLTPSATLHAFEIPPVPNGYVHDAAHLLTSEQSSEIDQKLRDFDQKTSSQIVVAIFPSLEGESLEDLSIRIATQWGIGQAGKDNGVLLSVFVAEHKVRIEVGYGLEAVIPDALASRIIEEKIKPSFQAENYFQGIADATDGLMQASLGEYPEDTSQSYKNKNMIISMCFFGVMLLYMLYWMFYDMRSVFKFFFKAIFFLPSLLIPSYRRAAAQSFRGWKEKNLDVFSRLKNDIGAHGVKGGFAKFSKDYEDKYGKSSSFDSGSSSDSGFSGGGGSFGGGGSSGSW